MRHPDLPPGQLIEVDEASVPHHRGAGWVVADAPPPPVSEPEAETAPENAPDPGGSDPDPAPETPSRRRAPKEAEK